MCGICGFTRSNANQGDVEDGRALKAMCDVMAHRGPDGEGRYVSEGIALGHRRLSLIDLKGGGQPMVRMTGELSSDVWSPAVMFDHERGQVAPVAAGVPHVDGATQADGTTHADGVAQAGGAAQADDMAQADDAAKTDGAAQAAGATQVDAVTQKRGRYSIVFNGEIYNYRELRDELQALGYEFATDSDTEVLLVGYIAWSQDVLQRLRGMFAFAVYDAQTKELFCARDFFGIKPFYYTVQNGQFIFASEIKCILEHPAYMRELNEAALAQYLCFQFSALHETFFKGVYKLPQGCYLRVGADGDVRITRYWQPSYSFDDARSAAETESAIDGAMRESVRYHNVADVEVGSFLSSGIDSSYLAACLAQENPDIKTFTVGFAEYEGERDEVSWARDLAQRLGVANESKHISEDEFWDALPIVQWHMDEPSGDPSAVALYYVDKLAARRVKAVLSGEGADEFFAGYRVYQAPLAAEHMGMVPKPLLHAGSKVLRAVGGRGANYLERASEDVEDWYYTNANGVAFSPAERDRILAVNVRSRLVREGLPAGARAAIGLPARDSDDASARFDAPIAGMASPQQLVAPVYAEVASVGAVSRMQYVDLWFWLVGDILLKTDKMSMAHSLESRVPFLDREVFALAATIPVSQNVDEGQTKLTLRRAAERVIPVDWAQKQKLGFPVPVSAWLREEERYNQVKAEFASAEAKRFFDTHELMRLLDEHRAGKADHARRIWIVYSFLVWYRAYFVDCKKPE